MIKLAAQLVIKMNIRRIETHCVRLGVAVGWRQTNNNNDKDVFEHGWVSSADTTNDNCRVFAAGVDKMTNIRYVCEPIV